MRPSVAVFLKSLWHICGYGPDPGIDARSSDGHTPLHFAVCYANLDALEGLLQEGADPNACDGDGNTPLHWAALEGSFEAAKKLVEHDASLEERNVDGRTAEQIAEARKSPSVAELLRVERLRRTRAK